MKVYIAGPYSRPNRLTNVWHAIRVANEIRELGHLPFVPHFYHFWDERFPHTYDYWMKMCLEWLKECDILIRLPGKSKGADIEIKFAKLREIKVIYSTEELERKEENGNDLST